MNTNTNIVVAGMFASLMVAYKIITKRDELMLKRDQEREERMLKRDQERDELVYKLVAHILDKKQPEYE